MLQFYDFYEVSVLLRPWSTLHERTTVLIRVFSTLGIDSRTKFIQKLKENRDDISAALQMWLPKEEWSLLHSVLDSVSAEPIE